MTKTTSSQSTSKHFDHHQLLHALFYIFDAFERPLIPMVLLGDTAESAINKQELKGDSVHVGVLRKDLTESGMRIMNLYAEAVEVNKDYMVYFFEDVPIIVHILEYDDTLANPDIVYYQNESFYIPRDFTKHHYELQSPTL